MPLTLVGMGGLPLASVSRIEGQGALRFGDWSMVLLYNDPEKCITVGIVEAEEADSEFPFHGHAVEEWVVCFSGALRIENEDGESVELSPESPHYHIQAGESHRGTALLPHTKALFVNRPSDPGLM